MIPQETVQQIIQSADVVDVVGDFVSLKKRGANMIACCPFHNEKTPSFYVSPAKGIYKCFGCGQGGDAVRFIMELEGLSYPEALKWLAKKYGIEIVEKERTDEDLRAENERESLFIVSEYAEKYFHKNLLEDTEGRSIGLSYFKERGYTEATIEKFQLGYALEKWDALTTQAISGGFTLPILEKSGLSIVREDKDPIDRFRGRVVFPIHNVAGKPIAFGARILKVDKKAPKYLNSPETDIYHKSHIVYGIYHSKTAIRNADNCYLVEGYTDVVSLHQAGVENVVASSGTSLTKEQIQLIRRFTTNITVLYDGDAAGINASLRGTDLILEEGMNVKVVTFPEGEDPDSYVKKVGTDAFQDYLSLHSKSFIEFLIEIKDINSISEPNKKANEILSILTSISKIKNSFEVEEYLNILVRKAKVEYDYLQNSINSIRRKSNEAQLNKTKKVEFRKKEKLIPENNPKASNNIEKEGVENEILKELKLGIREENAHELFFLYNLINYGEVILDDEEEGGAISLLDYCHNEMADFQFSGITETMISEIFKSYLRGDFKFIENLFRHNDKEVRNLFVKLMSVRTELSQRWSEFEIYVVPYSEKLEDIVYKNILRIKWEYYDKKAKLIRDNENFENNSDLLKNFMDLIKIRNHLGNLLGIVVS